MVIRQGDIYWVDLGKPVGSAPGYKRPCVVVQRTTFNNGLLNTVIICVLTSNLRRAEVTGNVLLDLGEAQLPERSVVVVSQLYTVDRTQLGVKIGVLSRERMREVVAGIKRMLEAQQVTL